MESLIQYHSAAGCGVLLSLYTIPALGCSGLGLQASVLCPAPGKFTLGAPLRQCHSADIIHHIVRHHYSTH